jgi:signal peptide peptidase SppA
MKISTVQDTVWAIRDSKLKEINEFIERKLNDPAFARDSIFSEPYESKPYRVENEIAVVPVQDVLMKRANLMMHFSGGTSTEMLQRDIQMALNDPSVKGIVLDVNSPGGEVHGTKSIADFIFASRGTKPIVAFCDGQCCSAAMWIASACDEIVSQATSEVGSIGVCLTHIDQSKREAESGVVKTYITAGKYKRMTAGPITPESKEYMQSQVDQLYKVFVEDVSRNLGVSVDKVLKMADGKVFIGTEALEMGLVHKLGGMDAAFEAACKVKPKKKKGKTMTVEEMQAQLEASNAKIAELSTIASQIPDLQKSLEAQVKANYVLMKQVKMKEIEKSVSAAVAEGKVAPRLVEAGIVAFIAALDGAPKVVSGSEEIDASEWFMKHFVTEASPVIIPGTVAEDGSPRTGSDEFDADKLAAEIAAYVNID